jgi:uncharacterized OB-fold protein
VIREGTIRLPFEYAAGRVAGRFLVALRDRQTILATRCGGCALVICPARSLCPRCGGDAEATLEVGPGGILLAHTVVPGRGGFGLIRLDGADTALLHRLLGPERRWKPGARVRPRFAADRRARIDDIDGFEPEEAAR